MHVSVNELDAQIRRAARGAGMSWGGAEEAGRAARRLASHGFDIADRLAELLERRFIDALGDPGGEIVLRRNALSGSSGISDPLQLGPVLCDHAFLIEEQGSVRVAMVAHPILLLPFILNAPVLRGASLEISWPGAGMVIDRARFDPGTCRELDALAQADWVDFAWTGETMQPRQHRLAWLGVEIDPLTWKRLDRLSGRTYVPASEQSRKRGAGAGNIDND